ncbi:aminomethyl transferase family protein, partial [Escherichia coli]|nr:aminomethyl transferase family protein [Escherichia coli]
MTPKATVSENCVTPFHEMTASLSQTTWWYGWSNYVMPDVYSDPVSELSAIRERVAMIDMSPLPKIEITGPDAEKFVDYLTVRKTTKNVVGHVLYTAWCTHEGNLISDGLVFRHEQDRYILGVDNCLEWIKSNVDG